MIEVDNLSFRYGDKEVVRDLSFSLQKGEILGVVGPNGAGKSTLIGLLTRLLKPSQGEVRLFGKRVQGVGRLELARSLAALPQGGELPEAFNVRDIVMMGRTPHLGFLASETQKDVDIAEAAMRRTDTWVFRERAVGSLSGGEKQRVLLARALTQEPEFLLLDEPTNHLDLKYQVEVLRFVKREVARAWGRLSSCTTSTWRRGFVTVSSSCSAARASRWEYPKRY